MKILILISGRVNYISDQNFLEIKKVLKEHEISFFFTPWHGQDEKTMEKFINLYQPEGIKKIFPNNINYNTKNIKYPDNAGSIEGFFYNWDGLIQGLNEMKKYCITNKKFPDFILRYRADILPKIDTNFKIKNKLKENEIIIPDIYHWNGLNDQIFLFKYDSIDIFNDFFNFVNKEIVSKSFFSSELIFLKYLKVKKIKVFFNQFEYNLLRSKKFVKVPTIHNVSSKIPINDKLIIKINKLQYKFRNFKRFFISKRIRSNKQDIILNEKNEI